MPSLGPLVLVRFLAGAGAAAVIPVAIAWIGDVVPYERRQPVLARFLSGQILGIVFGQAAGGLLGELIGWRGALVVLGLVHIAAGLLLLGEMRRLERRPARCDGDCAGAKRGVGRRRAAQPWARIVLGSSVPRRHRHVRRLRLRRRRAASCASVSSLGVVGAMLASFGAGALLYSLDRRPAGAALGQPGLAGGGGSVLCGRLRHARRSRRGCWLAPPAIALIGLGFYMLHNTLQTNATQMAPEARGLAISLFAIVLFTGQSVGVALAAPVMDRYGGAADLPGRRRWPLLAIAFWFRRQLMRAAEPEAARSAQPQCVRGARICART